MKSPEVNRIMMGASIISATTALYLGAHVITAEGHTQRHNENVAECAASVGPVTTDYDQLPAGCDVMFDGIDTHVGDTAVLGYTVSSSREITALNTKTDQETTAFRMRAGGTALGLGVLSAGLFIYQRESRRKHSLAQPLSTFEIEQAETMPDHVFDKELKRLLRKRNVL